MEIYINEDDELLKDHGKEIEVVTNNEAVFAFMFVCALLVYIFLIPYTGI